MFLSVEDKSATPDAIESEITKIATGVCNQAVIEDWANKLWTKNLIFSVSQLGKQLGYYVCPDQENAQGGWLYDLTWLKYSENHERLIGLPLVYESEWDPHVGYIDDDFQKLLVARAEHRVMVCQGPDPERQFKRFADQVRDCALTQAGDRYLFLCLDLNDKKFKARVLVA